MKRFTKLFLTLALLVVAGSVSAQTQVHATFEKPSNTNTSWAADASGETKGTFKWTETYYNQLRNIGLPSGDISKYKKLVVDCKMVKGEMFRVLIYKGGSNKTLWVKDGVNEFILKDELEKLGSDYNEYLLECTEICLSGDGGGREGAAGQGEVVINDVYLETYPEGEGEEIPEIEYEEDPGKPEGDFVDFTEAFPELQPRIGLGEDTHPIVLGNGDVVVGQRLKNVIADLSLYTKLTMITSPNMKLVLYMNHEVDAQQNAGDYAEADAGKYVFMNVQADENGLIEVDLTQFDKQELNCICLPWDNSNKGTVWYLLLTEATSIPVTIGEAGYATFCSKKAVALESSVEAYAVDFTGTSALLIPVEGSVDANTPVILKASAGDYELTIADSGAAPEKNHLQVSDGSVEGNGSVYVLANINDVVGFYLLAEGLKVPAGKAYLEASAGGREFIGFGEATAIKSVETVKADGAIYNLAGQQVKKAQKGIFIQNGKKVIK